ncbi:ABC transporter permease [Paenibacillus hodogayensis]|uniref:ABC transporter permease n=1 Tax=Paenibacillus hodogayensis TaxID=279208 RepID=A0ABV5W3Q9_9BACL
MNQKRNSYRNYYKKGGDILKNVYVSFAEKSFRQRFVYRANSYFYIISSILRLSILISLWTALLGEGQVVKGTTLEDMTAFVVINMVVLSMTRSNIGNKLAQRFEDGTIATDFIRPVSLKYYLISEQMGENLYSAVFHIIPVCVISVLFLQFRWPDEPWQWAMFALTLLFGMWLVYQIHYVVGLLVFWLKTSMYTNWMLSALMELFAGSVVPLWFYPDLLYKLAMLLPFRFISFEPLAIFLGKTTLAASVQVAAMQLVWIFVLLLLEKAVWRQVQKKVIIQGG